MKTLRILFVVFATFSCFMSCSAQQLTSEPVLEQEKALHVLCVGNSFTYFYDSHLQFQQLAAKEGHAVDVVAAYTGGYTFERHLGDEKMLAKIDKGGYDVVFLQDQSQAAAYYALNQEERHDILDFMVQLMERIRQTSPDAMFILERTWSYPGNDAGGFADEARFNELLEEGAHLLAEKTGVKLSPIGNAFWTLRKETEKIDLFFEDGKHQSAYGSFLKACVNYQMLFGEPFKGETNYMAPTHPITVNVPENPWENLDEAACLFLRDIAVETVKQ